MFVVFKKIFPDMFLIKNIITKLQMVFEFIITRTFQFKILVVIQNDLLLFVKIVRLYFFPFFKSKMILEIIKLKI